MPNLLTFRQAAERLGLHSPRVLSDCIYNNTLPDELFHLVGSRRTVPETSLSAIASALRRAGRLSISQD